MRTYQTLVDNQQEVLFGIYQGEARLVSDNVRISDLKVPMRAGPAGQRVDVRFSYDINGLLEVDVHVPSEDLRYGMVIADEGEDQQRDLTKRREALAKLKVHPRDTEANRAALARADRCWQDDPEGFQRLREAYEQAMRMATRPRSVPEPIAAAEVARPQIEATAADPVEKQDDIARLRHALDEYGSALAAGLKSDDPARWAGAHEMQARILASPLLDDLVLRGSIEMWMAHQIATHPVRSDEMIDPAVSFFGWGERGFRQPAPGVVAVLRRREEIALAKALAAPDHPWHRGWRALTRATIPGWRRRIEAMRPGTRAQVFAVLQKAATLPGLRHDMDAEAMTWWQRQPPRSRLVSVAWAAPMSLLLSLLAMLAISALTHVFALSAGLTGATAVALGMAAGQTLFIRPRLAGWLRHQPRAADDRWWIGAVALLPLLGWVAPLTPLMLLVLVVIGGGVLAWQDAWLAAFPPRSGPRRAPWQVGATLLWLVFVSGGVANSLGQPRIFPWVAVTVPFMLIWYRGAGAITLRLSRLSPGPRRILVIVALLLGYDSHRPGAGRP